MSRRWSPAADEAFRNTGPEPADAGFLTRGGSREGADSPARVPNAANTWPVESGRRQTLDELIREAQRQIFQKSDVPPDAGLTDNTAITFQQMPGQNDS